MNHGDLSIIMAAHKAAQKAAFNAAEFNGYYKEESKAVIRKTALDTLERLGFNRFILSTGDCVTLQPLAHGTRKADHGESWEHWAVYNLAEVKAYCKLVGHEDLIVVEHGEKCPACGGYVTSSSTHGCNICVECEECFDSRADDSVLSVCESPYYSHYGGPGQSFNHDAFARICRGRVLVIQSGGLDV